MLTLKLLWHGFIIDADLQNYYMVPRVGFEPTAPSLGRRCSIQLSYRGMCGPLQTASKLVMFCVHNGVVAEVVIVGFFIAKPQFYFILGFSGSFAGVEQVVD